MLLVSDRVRLDVVAILSLLALALTGIVPVDVALSGFANPTVLMLAGLFVVGAALMYTGVADWLGRRLERVAGSSEVQMIVVVTATTAIVSAFMSSTGTVAILLPIVGTLALRRGLAPGRLLMPLAFGAHLGSNLTLISTPPNLVVSDALRDAGHGSFRFFDFTLPGVVVLVVGIGYLAFVGRRALPTGGPVAAPKRALTDEELATEYELGRALCTVVVPPSSPLVGRTLADANLRAAHGVTVAAVLRDGESLRVVPSLEFDANDELRVLGTPEAIDALAHALDLELRPSPTTFRLPPEESLAEIVVPRRSRLVGRTLREAKFRDHYRATVLALRRLEAGRPTCFTQESLRDLRVRAGDTMLVKGRRRYLRNIRDERADFVLVAESDAPTDVIVDRPRAIGAVAITLAMLVVMAFGWVPNVLAVLLAAVMLVVTGCLRPADIYRSVNWESIVLVAGLLPLALALELTGVTAHVVQGVQGVLAGASPRWVLALLCVITSALGMVLSNTATAVLVAPVAVGLASAFGIAPEPLLIGVAFAASAAFATPIASPVNVLVMVPGNYRFADYTRVGLPLQLLVLATAVVVIPWAWPFDG